MFQESDFLRRYWDSKVITQKTNLKLNNQRNDPRWGCKFNKKKKNKKTQEFRQTFQTADASVLLKAAMQNTIKT